MVIDWPLTVQKLKGDGSSFGENNLSHQEKDHLPPVKCTFLTVATSLCSVPKLGAGPGT